MTSLESSYSKGIVLFLKYIYKRLIDGYKFSGDESKVDTIFDVYEQFCELNNLTKVGKIKFNRVMNDMGIETFIIWDNKTRRQKRVFSLEIDTLKSLIPFFDKPETSKVVTYIEIENKRYRLSIEVEKMQTDIALPIKERVAELENQSVNQPEQPSAQE